MDLLRKPVENKTMLPVDILYLVLHPFQNVGHFGFSRFIVFAMHLDITYV